VFSFNDIKRLSAKTQAKRRPKVFLHHNYSYFLLGFFDCLHPT